MLKLVTAAAIAVKLLAPDLTLAQSLTPVRVDVTYASLPERDLLFDLYLPREVASPPLLVWVHGGAWRGGAKDRLVPTRFVDDGFALASLDFRLSGEAPFPAQVHDIKAAIRYLRANQNQLGVDATRIVIMGASSGAHLASLVGVTNGVGAMEGDLGDYVGTSSDVQGIVSYFGASNLTTILAQSTPHGLSVREPALELFLGSLPDVAPSVARAASPVFHVDSSDPALLLLHGDQDPQMPINQSHELDGAYSEAGLDSTLRVVHGAGHGWTEFFEGAPYDLTVEFLRRIVER